MSTTELSPVAFAVHTRDEEEDYRWFEPQGETNLFDRMKSLHKEVISDMGRGKPATFCLVEEEGGIAVLAANLETERVDHSRTRVNDTLFLEFAHQDRHIVYRLCVGLLGNQSAAIQASLVEYAETVYQSTAANKPLEISAFTIDGANLTDAQEGDLVSSATALHALDDSIAIASHHLSFRANEESGRSKSFCFVFTGLTGAEKLADAAEPFDSFLALSRSKSIELDEQTDLRSFGQRKKRPATLNNGRQLRRPPVYLIGLLALSALALVPWAISQQTTSSDSNREMPSSNQKTVGSTEKTASSNQKKGVSIEKTPSLEPSQTASSTNSEVVDPGGSEDAEFVAFSLASGGRLTDNSENEPGLLGENFTIKSDQPFVAPIGVANNGKVRLEFKIDIEAETDLKLVVGNEASAGVVIEVASRRVDKQQNVFVSVAKPGDNSSDAQSLPIHPNIKTGPLIKVVLRISDNGMTMQVGSQIMRRDGDYSIGDDAKLQFAASRGRASIVGLQVSVGRPNVKREGVDED